MSKKLLCLAVLSIAFMARIVFAQNKGYYADVNGMKMYYKVSGKGDPLIVLHGAYMNVPLMGKIIPRLAHMHKVYAFEFQDHGAEKRYDIPFYERRY